jgi:hypothetical protein
MDRHLGYLALSLREIWTRAIYTNSYLALSRKPEYLILVYVIRLSFKAFIGRKLFMTPNYILLIANPKLYI